MTLSAVGTKPFTGDLTSLFSRAIVRDAAVVRDIGGTACVLALSPTASRAISLNGTTDVALTIPSSPSAAAVVGRASSSCG